MRYVFSYSRNETVNTVQIKLLLLLILKLVYQYPNHGKQSAQFLKIFFYIGSELNNKAISKELIWISLLHIHFLHILNYNWIGVS